MKFSNINLLTVLIAFAIVSNNPIGGIAKAGAYGERERHHQCADLRRSGKLHWYGIASGIIDEHGGRSGYAGFHTKSCHANRRSCQRWVSNIYNVIRNADSVRTAYCKPVN